MGTSLDEAIATVAARSHGLFARVHLDTLGVSHTEVAHRVASGRWEPVHDGVYRIAGAPCSWEADLLAACWAGGNRASASHRSALALRDLPGGRRDLVEIMCPRWQRARHDGLVVHETGADFDADVVLVRGIPCTTTERTLFDLAALGRTKTLDLAIDAALRRELTTLAALDEAVRRLAKRGRRGSALFRRAVGARDPGATVPDSAPERLLAIAFVANGLPEPELQFVVRDVGGAFVARVDLAFPDDRILVEYESIEHHTGKDALLHDSARRNVVTGLGYRVLTATVQDLHDGACSLTRTIQRLRTVPA
jgi:hypothetical protein